MSIKYRIQALMSIGTAFTQSLNRSYSAHYGIEIGAILILQNVKIRCVSCNQREKHFHHGCLKTDL